MRGGLRTKEGGEERVGSIVHRVVVQALHRRRRLPRVQGGGDEQMDSRTTNESPENKNQMREAIKG